MKITIEIPDAIAQTLQSRWSNVTEQAKSLLIQAAQQSDVDTETAESSPQPDLDVMAYMDRQAALYTAQKEQLLQDYSGLYIHFEEGRVLDSDPSLENLVLRAFEASGSRDLFIKKVEEHSATPTVRTPFLH